MLRRVTFYVASLAVLGFLLASDFGKGALADWIDTKTGQHVAHFPIAPGAGDYPFGSNHVVLPNIGDPNRAYDPVTQRNFAKNECGDWIDTKTGKRVTSFPIAPGTGDYPFGSNHVVLPNIGDPNRAYDPVTQRNFAREACPPPSTPPRQVGMRSDLPYGLDIEGTLFAGGVTATSFGTRYSTNLFGGRGAIGMTLPGDFFRLQLDGEGVKTGNYSTVAGDRSYRAGGLHLDWLVTPSIDIGGFGGYQRVTPTFFGATSTNGFFGVEGRAFINQFMIGAQVGRFDVSSGPGTLTDAGFGEARFKFDLGSLYRPSFPNMILGGGIGYASGKLSNTLLDADTTYWNATLAFPLPNTPVTAYVGYMGYRNSVQGRGTVWNESIVKGGIQINFGSPGSPQKAIEPNQPLPLMLRTIATF